MFSIVAFSAHNCALHIYGRPCAIGSKNEVHNFDNWFGVAMVVFHVAVDVRPASFWMRVCDCIYRIFLMICWPLWHFPEHYLECGRRNYLPFDSAIPIWPFYGRNVCCSSHRHRYHFPHPIRLLSIRLDAHSNGAIMHSHSGIFDRTFDMLGFWCSGDAFQRISYSRWWNCTRWLNWRHNCGKCVFQCSNSNIEIIVELFK